MAAYTAVGTHREQTARAGAAIRFAGKTIKKFEDIRFQKPAAKAALEHLEENAVYQILEYLNDEGRLELKNKDTSLVKIVFYCSFSPCTQCTRTINDWYKQIRDSIHEYSAHQVQFKLEFKTAYTHAAHRGKTLPSAAAAAAAADEGGGHYWESRAAAIAGYNEIIRNSDTLQVTSRKLGKPKTIPAINIKQYGTPSLAVVGIPPAANAVAAAASAVVEAKSEDGPRKKVKFKNGEKID